MITIIVGTRPELIKTAPVVHELMRRNVPFEIVHTGQHYTETLDQIFFRELELPQPIINLQVGSQPAAYQVAEILKGVAGHLQQGKEHWVLVQGDTNSVLGGALAAHKLGVPVAHLEAGLRSDDWEMPEEGNRVLAGRVAAVHFCPTDLQQKRLAAEGITRGVHVVGNTVVDATLHFTRRARTLSRVLEDLKVDERSFGLVTLHRPSNVDDPERLGRLLQALARMANDLRIPLIFPVHPRTRAQIRTHKLEHHLASPFIACEPLGYIDMLRLLDAARVVLTDSGGIQEEACTLRVPCVTLRANTERPETITVGANVLCNSVDGAALTKAAEKLLRILPKWVNPFGDGRAAARVVDVLCSPETRTRPSGHP